MSYYKYPRFSFKGRTLHYECNQLKLHDPDTLLGAFPVEGVMYEHSFRIRGYDSIENRIPKKDLIQLTDQYREALLTRREQAIYYTKSLLESHSCTVVTHESDKYGRILADVTVNTESGGLSLAQTLIERKLVFPYDGATKLTLYQQADFCLATSASSDHTC